jgi:hypothetical protein
MEYHAIVGGIGSNTNIQKLTYNRQKNWKFA